MSYCCNVRYLNDEDDDVSMAVIPFAVGYVGVLKVSVYIMSIPTLPDPLTVTE